MEYSTKIFLMEHVLRFDHLSRILKLKGTDVVKHIHYQYMY